VQCNYTYKCSTTAKRDAQDTNLSVDTEILFCLLRKDQPIGGVQGLSMDRAVIDLGNGIFAHGQAYVALSRVRSLAGVLLSNFCEASFKKTSRKVLLEYERFRNMV
jgi:hypothetical protein